MKTFVIHDAAGVIAQVNTVDDSIFADLAGMTLAAGQSLLAIEPPADIPSYLQQHYVAEGVVTERAAMAPTVSKTSITADGIDIAAITGLPIPCEATVSGSMTAGPLTIDDGALDVSCDYVGAVTVTVTAGPAWLPWTVTITATEA